jgi:excinuclease ABC subunit B
MEYAISETNRRRALQEAHNLAEGITPQTISKSIRKVIRGEEPLLNEAELPEITDRDSLLARITELELDMWQASEDLDFEKAARMRDEIRSLEAKLSGQTLKAVTVPGGKPSGGKRGARRR